MPRYKPLLLWEPLPYLLIVVLLVLTSFVRPESPPWLLWPLVAGIAACLVWVAVLARRERRAGDPDTAGNLRSLEGLAVTDVPAASRAVRAVAPVADVERHQPAIDLARLHGGAEQHAVLVPRASRWLSPRYRVGVQLVGGDRPRHAGFLRPDAEAALGGLLDRRRAAGEYLRVPAFITGDTRPFGVELDVSGLGALEPSVAPEPSGA